jgi:acetyl esterase/lipase
MLIAGASAGGGLAAGVALLTRDRKGPKLTGQMLICPMLDDRDRTVSSNQFDGLGLWDRASNVLGWTALLGSRRVSDDVSIYATPARAKDLSHLPPAFIDCGSAEVFRDEDVAYASALWAAGVQAELHVWPGGFHGFDMIVPTSPISQAAIAARDAWIKRHLST